MIADHIVLPSGTLPAKLPVPDSQRFRPLRCGLINLYRYDHQEFHFEQGRLLLRGNNGTGKSRVLALTLPFLLDGDVGPDRLEPDGDSAKRIEWNLLLGGKHSDRTGYAFIEFGRRDDEGEHFVTLGCGLHAVSGSGLTGKWFFITRQRIGQELFLVARGGYPLGRERLGEALGNRGQLFTSAAQYRREVDQALFQLGPQRYEALVRLLIQLRKPQLSRRLDEKALSQALSEALAPLPQPVLSTVADAFRGLDQDRQELDNIRRAQEAVTEFLAHYRRYAQTVTRRRAAQVRKEHASYEEAQRHLRLADAECKAAAARLAALTEQVLELEQQERINEEEIRLLSSRPELADGQRIESERRRADELQRQAESTQKDARKAEQTARERDAAYGVAATNADGALAKAAQSLGLAAQAAMAAGLTDPSAALLPLGTIEDSVVKQTERALRQLVEQRQRAAVELGKLNEELKTARDSFDRARGTENDRRQELDGRLTNEAEARDGLLAARDALGAAYRTWATELRELRPLAAEEVLALLLEWVEASDGAATGPVDSAVRSAQKEALIRLSAAAQAGTQQVEAAERLLAELSAERERVLTARHLPPVPPYTRDTAARAERPGAPLWVLCDFRPDVPPAVRAALEAALEAAGLLDAWLLPDGRLLESGTCDSALVLAAPTPQARHLGELLCPAVDRSRPQVAAVTDATVAAVLAQIGLGEPEAGSPSAVWVTQQGRFRLGPLVGQWQKEAAQHIGEGARAAHRRQRLTELDAQMEVAATELQRCQGVLSAVRRQQEQAQHEAEQAPSERALLTAIATLTRARHESLLARDRFEKAEQHTTACRQQCERKRGTRDELARELGLAEWVEKLGELREALSGYREALSGLLAAVHLFISKRQHAEQLAQLLEAARRDETRWRDQASEAQNQATAVRRAYEVLEQTVGSEFRAIAQLLQAAEERKAEVRRAVEAARKEASLQIAGQATAQSDVQRHTETMARHAGERDKAIGQLRTLVELQLLFLAVPDVAAPSLQEDWSVRSAVELSRLVEPNLSKIDAGDETWQRLRNDIFQRGKAVEAALSSQGHTTALSEVDEVFTVTAQLGERMVPIETLRTFLDDQIETRQALLSQHEREVLENHLISEVAQELHDHIQQAEALVRETNKELEARPTTMGIKLRFAWGPGDNAPTGLADVRRLMLRTVGAWSPAERQTVVAFLQRQIQRARQENPIGTWLEQLGTAFDYRGWHQFVIERHQDGVWQRMTRKSFGTGSGGEKAVGLTLPQFAAAAAHYRSASALAPRLILLDEVFVGIDRDMRGKCMALLRDFDLDFVMTSENEWGCYATLPGVAICHLSARAGIDAVAVTRWVWTGQERRAADVVTPPMTAPAAAAESVAG